MGLTHCKLAVGDLIFDARLCGPEGGTVVVLLHGWPEFSSWWRDSLEALGAIPGRRFRPAWLFPWCQTARRG
jgi:pimeloyl-ACP methyl ester carboxylesterase